MTITRAGIIFVDWSVCSVMIIKSHHGWWSFPKGSIKYEETYAETASRECREETGFHISSSALNKLTFITLDQTRYFIIETVAADWTDSKTLDTVEVAEIGWKSFKELKDLNANKGLKQFLKRVETKAIKKCNSNATRRDQIVSHPVSAAQK